LPATKTPNFISRLFGGSREAVWLVVGLGNPGPAYESTRHNVGFRAVDVISAKISVPVRKGRLGALIGEGRFEGGKIVLVKPQTFMNLSGEAVRKALGYYKASPENMIVIYDDVDIGLGKIRLRAFGGPGSHNGMRSIADNIGEGAKFPRIRVGIGQQPNHMELKDYVLTRFRPEEEDAANSAISKAAEAALDIISLGVERAMNAHNPKKR